MPAGDSAEGKRRYRKRAQERLSDNGEVVSLHAVGGAIAAERAAYNRKPTRTFEEMIEVGYEHVADFEAKFQQLNKTHVLIITLQAPKAYVQQVLAASDAEGSLMFRVYAPPRVEYEYEEDEGDEDAA